MEQWFLTPLLALECPRIVYTDLNGLFCKATPMRQSGREGGGRSRGICAEAAADASLPPPGVVNLLPVDMIHEHEGARPPGASLLCGSGKARDFLPGVESLAHLLTV